MKVKLNDEDISELKECIPIISDNASNNKRLQHENRKDSIIPDKTIVFPAFDLSTKRLESAMEIHELLQLPMKFDVIQLMLHY